MPEIEEKIREHLHFLNLQDDPQKALLELLKSEYEKRLAHYENMDQAFRKKYKMSFGLFERNNVVRERGFSWEVESDSMDWEQAIDGIKTMNSRIEEIDALSQEI